MSNKIYIKENLKELKSRLIKSLIFFFTIFVIFFFNSKIPLDFLSNSLINTITQNINFKEIELGFFDLISPFALKINLSFIISIYLSVPFFIYQIYRFISPGLYKSEKFFILPYIILSPILFFIGSLFVFFLIIPNAQFFFLNISNNFNTSHKIRMIIDIQKYISMCFDLFFLFGLAFQFPLIIQILLKLNLINVDQLKKIRKFIIVFIFIISAILTPPDILSQIMLAVPLIILYEIIILLNRIKKI